MTDDLRPLLDRLLAEARTGLVDATGGDAVCASTKAGAPAPGAKYHEGRWAALHEVASRCRRGAQEPVDAALEVRGHWLTDLDRLTARAAGPDWIAYRHGGLDALADLIPGPAPDPGRESPQPAQDGPG